MNKTAVILLAIAFTIFSGFGISVGPIQFEIANPAHAGFGSKVAKSYISARLMKAMLVHGSKSARKVAERKVFNVIKNNPNLAESALQKLQSHATSRKAQYHLNGPRAQEIKSDIELASLRLKAWNKPNLVGSTKDKVLFNRPDDTVIKNVLRDLHRKSSNENVIGNGSTADALRYERATGQMVGGRLHDDKATKGILSIQKWLRENRHHATKEETDTLTKVLRDLKHAKGYP